MIRIIFLFLKKKKEKKKGKNNWCTMQDRNFIFV